MRSGSVLVLCLRLKLIIPVLSLPTESRAASTDGLITVSMLQANATLFLAAA